MIVKNSTSGNAPSSNHHLLLNWRTIVKLFIYILVYILLLLIFNYIFLKSKAIVSFTLQTREPSRVQVYWSKVDRPYLKTQCRTLSPERQSHRYLLHIGDLGQISKIRIDPGTSPGTYWISDIKIVQAGYEILQYNTPETLRRITPLNQIERLEHDNHRIVFSATGNDPQIELTISAVPTAKRHIWKLFNYYQYQSYGLVIVMAVFMIVPGTLLYSIIPFKTRSWSRYNSLFFACSILMYLLLYLFFIAGQLYGDTGMLLAVFLALIAVLVLINLVKDSLETFMWHIRRSARAYALYCAILLTACFVISMGLLRPFDKMTYHDISGPKTFNAFRAHDNKFQFVNGLAIANNEPFSKYYGGRALIYKVQDREILPGVLYAMIRKLMSPLSTPIAESFFTYTLMGTCMNLMIMFPLMALYSHFFGAQRQYLMIAVISVSAFVFPNYYFTWFKLSGAALFLSALWWILRNYRQADGWWMSGLLFGLSANMHAGNALGIPFILIWFVIKSLRETPRSLKNLLIYPVCFVGLFVLTNLPWAVVKKIFFPDNYSLIREHFLMGVPAKGSLIEAVVAFFKTTPLATQIPIRLGHLSDALRLNEIGQLMSFLKASEFNDFWIYWCRHEWNYIAFAIFPLLLFALPQGVMHCYRCRQTSATAHAGSTGAWSEAAWMLILTLTAMVAIIFAGYSKHSPDIVYAHPMGIIILAQMVLIGFILNGKSPWVRNGFYLFVGISFYRLISAYAFYMQRQI